MRIGNVRDATLEELRQLQLKELEILKKVDRVLKINNVPYFIIGGTLIGALRDKGFISWDDDIDIMMPRDQFENLYKHQAWFDGTNLVMFRSNEKVNQHLTGMTVKDTQTTFINKHSIHEKLQHSISIDIMPLDYRPVGKFREYLQMFYAAVFSLYNADRMPDHQGRLLRILSWLPLKMVPGKELKYKIWSWAERKMVALGDPASEEVVELGVGLRSLKRRLPASYFESTVDVQFEDIVLPAPIEYDKYLRSIVGDYMSLPSAEDRKPKHNTYLVDTELAYNESVRRALISKISR